MCLHACCFIIVLTIKNGPVHCTGGIRAWEPHELSQWIKITQSPVLNNFVLMCSENAETVSAPRSACLSPKVGCYGTYLLPLNQITKAMEQCRRKSQGIMGKQLGLWSPTLTNWLLASRFEAYLVCLGFFPLFGRTQLHAIMLCSDAQVGNLSPSACGPSATRHAQELEKSPKGSWGLNPAHLNTHHHILLFPQQYGPGTLWGLESSLHDLI